MTYYVYILKCQKKDRDSYVLYTGQTWNFYKRFFEHTHKIRKKAYTRHWDIFKLVYLETFDTKKEALAREKEIKSLRKRREKIKFIHSNTNMVNKFHRNINLKKLIPYRKGIL